jgi:hypothetical protein
MINRPRIFEEIHVIDEDGSECQVFTREMDPKVYYIGPALRDAEWILHVLRVPHDRLMWHGVLGYLP